MKEFAKIVEKAVAKAKLADFLRAQNANAFLQEILTGDAYTLDSTGYGVISSASKLCQRVAASDYANAPDAVQRDILRGMKTESRVKGKAWAHPVELDWTALPQGQRYIALRDAALAHDDMSTEEGTILFRQAKTAHSNLRQSVAVISAKAETMPTPQIALRLLGQYVVALESNDEALLKITLAGKLFVPAQPELSTV
jgi:hypothetical protein